jgi:hypothetical protein
MASEQAKTVAKKQGKAAALKELKADMMEQAKSGAFSEAVMEGFELDGDSIITDMEAALVAIKGKIAEDLGGVEGEGKDGKTEDGDSAKDAAKDAAGEVPRRAEIWALPVARMILGDDDAVIDDFIRAYIQHGSVAGTKGKKGKPDTPAGFNVDKAWRRLKT